MITDPSSIQNFTASLLNEMRLRQEWASHMRFDTVYFGGGTPSLLPKTAWIQIKNAIEKYYSLESGLEFTIEVNPGTVSDEEWLLYKDLGINRISLGAQSFSEKNLKFLGRIHTADDILHAFHSARSAGFQNINLDMIFGLPGQSREQWLDDLGHAIDLHPEHVSAYSLTVESHTPLSHMVDSGSVSPIDEEVGADLFQITRRFLAQSGYRPYEVSNFSRTGYRCRHNMHYWTGSPYLGLGPSAHSFDGSCRSWNISSLSEYCRKLDQDQLPEDDSEILTPQQKFNESIMNGLRLTDGFRPADLNAFNLENMETWQKKSLEKWSQLEMAGPNLRLKPDAFLLLDEITADLFI